jgi:hypothetical protein
VTTSVKVIGADTLAATMRAAAGRLGQMDTANRKVAAGIAQTARARAPRRTGALARSTTGTAGAGNTAELTATVVYSGVIHNGWPRHHITAQPYLAQTIEGTQDQWESAYITEIQKILNTVRGA